MDLKLLLLSFVISIVNVSSQEVEKILDSVLNSFLKDIRLSDLERGKLLIHKHMKHEMYNSTCEKLMENFENSENGQLNIQGIQNMLISGARIVNLQLPEIVVAELAQKFLLFSDANNDNFIDYDDLYKNLHKILITIGTIFTDEFQKRKIVDL
jgi:hypothetical protein